MGKNNFRKVWKTLTELGLEFGVSAVKFGNLLKQYGLREKDGEPSQIGQDGGLFEKITPKEGKPYYLWHGEKTSEYLISQGVAKTGSIFKKDAANNIIVSPYQVLIGLTAIIQHKSKSTYCCPD